MRELDELPEAQRSSFVSGLVIGRVFTHKRSGREWTVKQIYRKDHAVLLEGPGVEKKITVPYDDLKRHWI